jgi:hypothetical protein
MNTQSKTVQFEQEAPTLNDLHLAFAGACYSYGSIVNARLDAENAINHQQWLVPYIEKLNTIAEQLRDKVCGEIPNTPAMDAQRQPANLTPTVEDLRSVFADSCYSYGLFVNHGLDACNVTNHLQWLAVHTAKFEAITKQLLSNACGGAE